MNLNWRSLDSSYPECTNYPYPVPYKKKEWNTILPTAKANGYPIPLLTKLNTNILQKCKSTTHNQWSYHYSKTWVTFTFHSPLIWKITNLLHNINLRRAFCTNNTIHNTLGTWTSNTDTHTHSGICQIKCHTCQWSYIWQTWCKLESRYKEHVQYN